MRVECTQSELNELDRKSTRLNSSHGSISYAVFCLKKKKKKKYAEKNDKKNKKKLHSRGNVINQTIILVFFIEIFIFDTHNPKSYTLLFFILIIPLPPTSTLLPYTTLFR